MLCVIGSRDEGIVPLVALSSMEISFSLLEFPDQIQLDPCLPHWELHHEPIWSRAGHSQNRKILRERTKSTRKYGCEALSEVSQFIKTHFQCRLQARWLRERDFHGKNNTYNGVGVGFLGRFETVLAVEIYATFGTSPSKAQRTAKKIFCSFYFSF